MVVFSWNQVSMVLSCFSSKSFVTFELILLAFNSCSLRGTNICDQVLFFILVHNMRWSLLVLKEGITGTLSKWLYVDQRLNDVFIFFRIRRNPDRPSCFFLSLVLPTNYLSAFGTAAVLSLCNFARQSTFPNLPFAYKFNIKVSRQNPSCGFDKVRQYELTMKLFNLIVLSGRRWVINLYDGFC